jgi:hypothetical protein
MNLDTYLLNDIALLLRDSNDISSIRLACKHFAKNIPVSVNASNPYIIINRTIRNDICTPEMISALFSKHFDTQLIFYDIFMPMSLLHETIPQYVFEHMSTAHMLAIASYTKPCDYDDFMNYMCRAFVKEDCADEACARIVAIAEIFNYKNAIKDIYNMFDHISAFVARVIAAPDDLAKNQIIVNYTRDYHENAHYCNMTIIVIIREKFCPNVIFDPTVRETIIGTIDETLERCTDSARVIRILREFGPNCALNLFRTCSRRRNDLAFWRAIRTALGPEAFAAQCAYQVFCVQVLVQNCFNADIRAFWRDVLIVDHALNLVSSIEYVDAIIHICYPSDAAALLLPSRIRADIELANDIPHNVKMFKHVCMNGALTANNCVSVFGAILYNYDCIICWGINPDAYLNIIIKMFPAPIREMRSAFIDRHKNAPKIVAFLRRI